MATETTIKSDALVLIGESIVSDFGVESTNQIKVANDLYEDVYFDLLAEHPWMFALKDADLVANVATPDTLTRYNETFDMPSDLIRVWEVFPHSDYTVVGALLYSNHTELHMRYVYKAAVTLAPLYFIRALKFALAAAYAIPLTGDKKMAEMYETKFYKALAKAQTVDSQSKPQLPIQDSPLTEVFD